MKSTAFHPSFQCTTRPTKQAGRSWMHPRKMIKRRKSLRLVRSISRVLDSSAAVAALPGATQTLQVLPGSAGDLFPAAAERLDQRCKNDGMKCLKGYENIKKNMDRATFPIGTIRRE